jgi:hypothetical protein
MSLLLQSKKRIYTFIDLEIKSNELLHQLQVLQLPMLSIQEMEWIGHD